MKRFDWRLAGAFALVLSFLLANALLANRSVQGLVKAHNLISHAWRVRLTVRDTQTQFERSLASIRGYFYLDDATMLTIWRESRQKLNSDVESAHLGILLQMPDQFVLQPLRVALL